MQLVRKGTDRVEEAPDRSFDRLAPAHGGCVAEAKAGVGSQKGGKRRSIPGIDAVNEIIQPADTVDRLRSGVRTAS